jgi:hypothetical protein
MTAFAGMTQKTPVGLNNMSPRRCQRGFPKESLMSVDTQLDDSVTIMPLVEGITLNAKTVFFAVPLLLSLYSLCSLAEASQADLKSWEGEWGRWEPWTFPDVGSSSGYALRISSCGVREVAEGFACTLQMYSRKDKVHCYEYEMTVPIRSSEHFEVQSENDSQGIDCRISFKKSGGQTPAIEVRYDGKCDKFCNEKVPGPRPNPIFAKTYPFRTAKTYLKDIGLGVIAFRDVDLAQCYGSASRAVQEWCTNKEILAFESQAQHLLHNGSSRCWESGEALKCLPEMEKQEKAYLAWRGSIWQKCEKVNAITECLATQYHPKLAEMNKKEKDINLALIGVKGSADEATKLISQLAGVYKTQHKITFIDDTSAWSEDVLEIVDVKPGTIYFKTRLYFDNGHQCSLFGAAQYKDNGTFTYQSPPGDEECVMRVKKENDVVVLEDVGGKCGAQSCGARGGYGGAKFPLTKRRTIKYMGLLKNSDDYKKSLAEAN